YTTLFRSEPVDAGIIDGADTAQIIHREAGFPIFLKLEPVQVDICDSCDAGSVGILEATAYRVQQPDLAGFWVAHTQVGAQQPVVEIEQGKLRVREIAVRQLARHRKESSMLVSDQLIEELDELVNHSGILRRCVVAAQPDTAAELFGPANQIARRRTEAAEDLVQRTAQLHAERQAQVVLDDGAGGAADVGACAFDARYVRQRQFLRERPQGSIGRKPNDSI